MPFAPPTIHGHTFVFDGSPFTCNGAVHVSAPSAGGPRANCQVVRGSREDQTTREIGRSCRSERTVHLHPGGELVDRKEDRVVARRRGRPVVDRIPLSVLGGACGDRVLLPCVA